MTQTRLKEQKSERGVALAPAAASARNPGCPLDLGWVEDARVNRSAVERRAASLPGRRSVKQDWQAAWLLRAIECIDLTTLSGDDTPGTVRRLCGKARRPVRADLLEALGVPQIQVGAVCVYHAFVATAEPRVSGSASPRALAASSAFRPAIRAESTRLI